MRAIRAYAAVIRRLYVLIPVNTGSVYYTARNFTQRLCIQQHTPAYHR